VWRDEVLPVAQPIPDASRDVGRIEARDLDSTDQREVDRPVDLDAVLRAQVFLVVDAHVEHVALPDRGVLALRLSSRRAKPRRRRTARRAGDERREERRDESRRETDEGHGPG